jgi:hypothetical protein
MDLLALLIGLTLAAGLIFFISRPLRKTRRASAAESQLDALSAEYESLLTQIRELDFDHATGKVDSADHAPLRARLIAQAADVRRRIDGLLDTTPRADAALEAAIAARRKRRPPDKTSLDAELESAIAARRKTPACPNCGKPLRPGDAFCSRCGAPVGTQAAR